MTTLHCQVPSDPALEGLAFFSQAMVMGRHGSKLTNALDGEFEGSGGAPLVRGKVSRPFGK
jgi:hypothetical protein